MSVRSNGAVGIGATTQLQRSAHPAAVPARYPRSRVIKKTPLSECSGEPAEHQDLISHYEQLCRDAMSPQPASAKDWGWRSFSDAK
jgi:hypothetical protein